MHLERLGFEHLADVVALEQCGQAHPWSVAQLESAFDDERSEVWGAWEVVGDETRLVGFAVFYWLPFEAELQAITVSPAARRQGVGRYLLARLAELAISRGNERLLLEVRRDNTAALTLYEAAGFDVDGHRRHYYVNADGTREDAVLMSRALADRGACRRFQDDAPSSLSNP
ncbi:ribosomal protein S18-alanine N-acetyltransferase [Halomonas sp. WWR20]